MRGNNPNKLALAVLCAAVVFAGASVASAQCSYDRPEPISIKFQHCTTRPCHWHAVTTFYQESASVWYFCNNNIGHYLDDVDGIQVGWRTTDELSCDYCAWEDWEPDYYQDDGSPSFEEMDDMDCWYDVGGSDDIVYWGQELDWYDGDYDFDSDQWVAKFERGDYPTNTDSYLKVETCIE